MEDRLLDIGYRRKIIEEIKSDENVQRKIVSYKKHNMQNDNFYQYVKEYMESKLDEETVSELHIFSNINLQKRVSKNEASIYKKEPTRSFYVGDVEIEGLGPIYDHADADTILKRANEAYKYQDQCAIQVYPEDQKLKARVLLPHHYDVVPDEMNPEKPMCYVISNFDNTSRDKIRKEESRTGFSQGDKYRDSVNQQIADYDDSKLSEERFYFHSKSYHFVTNGKGEYISKQDLKTVLPNDTDSRDINIISPLFKYQLTGFVDISSPKDFEFWVRSSDTLYDATIMYNVILTSEFQTVEMQGHAQPYYKGDAEHMPENIRVGVDKMIFIPINPQNEVGAEFGFANPGSDLAGIREFRESFLSSFLSSRGLDTTIVSGKATVNKASSGIEKMLQMIEKFEASQEDFSLFRNVEQQLGRIFVAYTSALKGERVDGKPVLGDDYQIAIPDPHKLSVNVEYAKPELIKTDMEKLEIADKEIEMGLTSRVHVLMEYKDMTWDQAVKHINEVDMLEGTAIKVDNPNEDTDEDIIEEE